MTAVSFVDVPLDGRTLSIEYTWIAREDDARRASAPLVVFLHEGLGSLSMWKDYPERLCNAGGFRGLVFSREGYGRSTPRAHDERWPVDFMHAQARDVLPGLFERLRVGADGTKPWLFGHSDGASIALIHAADFSDAVAGVVAVAPHIFVEDRSIRSIEAARDAYRTTDLRTRLARYHDDPDSAFRGWNDVWLDPGFRAWSIEAMLRHLRCPILAVQGEDDEYGTLAQVEGIRRCAPQAEIVVLSNCGHSPHRDQPEALTLTVVDFIVRHSKALTCQGEMQ
ncbi:MAG: alpha/beta fold hydrolase [Burkholderiales bacterium]